jgi:hypothetical protein
VSNLAQIFVFFSFFLPFFVFGVSRVFGLFFGFSPWALSYLFIWLTWHAVAKRLSKCVADIGRAFLAYRLRAVGSVGLFVCACIAGGCSHPVAGSLAGCQALEQVFDCFLGPVFQNVFNRILTEFLLFGALSA